MKHPYPAFFRLLLALLIGTLTVAGSGAQERVDTVVAATASENGEYLIGPGDTLQVFVWGQPDLSITVPVRPDGRVSTPLIEDLEAVGKTPTQLAREMEQVLSEFIRSPEVNVIVQKFVGTFGSQIRVLGQATKPGAVPYRERMTLLDVMIAVGGITDFAAGNKASILRIEGGKTRQFGVLLTDLIRGGDLSANVEMRPGDVLIIPQSFF